MKIIRSYNKLINEIINLQIPFRIEIIGYVSYDKEIFPMIAIRHISKMAKKNIIILAGQHGDEYYAVHVLLKWIAQIKLEDYPEFNFHIIPVANPYGYAHCSRRNGARQHVNNAIHFIKDSEVQELGIIYEHLPLNADLFLDIHGDVDKKNVYFYERKPEELPSIAEKTLLTCDNLLPYERFQTIYREKVQNGVIYKPEHDKSMDDILGNSGVEYTIALELPGKHDGQKRMIGGITIINELLKNYKEIK